MLESLAERERLTGLAVAGGWLALLAGLAASAWFASELVWRAFPDEGTASTPRATRALSANAPTTIRTDLRQLQLFGQTVSLNTAQPIEAPETTLALTLQGTLATDDPKSGLAIIANDQGREAYYGVGDDLPGSARLHEIHADRVILVRQGQYETLSLREDDGAAIRGRRGTPTQGRTAGQAPAQTPPNTPGIRGVDWQSVQQQYRVDPAQLARQIRALPQLKNGEFVGVKLQAGRNSTLMRRLQQAGIRSTDIVKSVNGSSIIELVQQQDQIGELLGSGPVTVVVERNGREQTLTIDLNQLADQ